MRRGAKPCEFINLSEQHRQGDRREWSPVTLRGNQRCAWIGRSLFQECFQLRANSAGEDDSPSLGALCLVSRELNLSADLACCRGDIANLERGDFSHAQTRIERKRECQTISGCMPGGLDDAKCASNLRVIEYRSLCHYQPKFMKKSVEWQYKIRSDLIKAIYFNAISDRFQQLRNEN